MINGLTMSRFILLCVVYNKKCAEAETILSFYNCLRQLNKYRNATIELHVWDNSNDIEIINFNKKYCKEQCIYHHFSGSNEFLSVVYNNFLLKYKYDFLLIFDDDSKVSYEYINAVIDSTECADFHVAVPRIISQEGTFYSPAKFGLVKGKHLNSISPGFYSDLVSISSGIVIDCKKIISKQVKFDENLNLYGVDTDFFLSLIRKGIAIYVLPVWLEHDLSIFNRETNLIKRKRLLNLLKSNLYIARKRSCFHFFCFLIYIPLVFFKNIKVFIFQS